MKLTGSAVFTITGDTCTASLPATAACTVTVRFAPASGAGFTAALTSASANQAAPPPSCSPLPWPPASSTGSRPGGAEIGQRHAGQAGLDGTSPQPIVPGQADPQGVAVGATHIYWVANGTRHEREANLDGSDATRRRHS